MRPLRRGRATTPDRTRPGRRNSLDAVLDDPSTATDPVARLLADAAAPVPADRSDAGLDAALVAYADAGRERANDAAVRTRRRRRSVLGGLAAATLATKLTAAGAAVAIGGLVVTVAVEHHDRTRHAPAGTVSPSAGQSRSSAGSTPARATPDVSPSDATGTTSGSPPGAATATPTTTPGPSGTVITSPTRPPFSSGPAPTDPQPSPSRGGTRGPTPTG